MSEKQTVLEQLQKFRQINKFSASAWNDRGLNPSNTEVCNRLEEVFNACANNLMDAVNANSSTKELKSVLKKHLKSLQSSDYDTEEREFICDYFIHLAHIVSVDFNGNLSDWLYGSVVSSFFKIASFFKNPNKAVETLTQDCTKCGAKLETIITAKEEGIPDYSWMIVQCNNCAEHNLVSVGPDVKEFGFNNCVFGEQLSKEEYSEEQANARVKQINFFRKK